MLSQTCLLGIVFKISVSIWNVASEKLKLVVFELEIIIKDLLTKNRELPAFQQTFHINSTSIKLKMISEF